MIGLVGLIKIINEKRYSNKCYVSFGAFCESSKDPKLICYKTFLKRQLINFGDNNNSDFQIENFPTLYFKHTKFNYTFELDYKDLFLKIGKKIFFMIIFPYSYIEHFELGKIFLKKYFFSYDADKKMIYFYNKNETKLKIFRFFKLN